MTDVFDILCVHVCFADNENLDAGSEFMLDGRIYVVQTDPDNSCHECDLEECGKYDILPWCQGKVFKEK